jgi:polyisoprenoid-binding protein YceI
MENKRMKDGRMISDSRLLAALASCLVVAIGPVGHAQPSEGKPSAPSSRAPYRIDAKKSRFIVETQTGGLSAMFSHDHKIEVRDFSGTATFERGSSTGTSLELTVRANSLFLLEEKDIGARQAIESALREEVLETEKYPEIAFKSRSVTSERRGDGTYDVRLVGEIRLHGVRRQMTVPARVSLQDGTLHAIGIFEIHQTDFKITPFSFVNGTVTIKDVVTLSFDIVATQSEPHVAH